MGGPNKTSTILVFAHGAFGLEDCDDYCPELNAMQNDPEFQRACLQEAMEMAERNAGWDPRP